MSDDLNDDLADLLGSAPRTEPVQRGQEYEPAIDRTYDERCPKCRGSGKFRGYSGRVFGDCFHCKGTGKLSFKTPPEQRAKARARTAAHKAEDRAAFESEYKAELAWLRETAARQLTRATPWDFPVKLAESLAQYGSLTDNQLAAVRKCMVRDAERTAARQAEQEARHATAQEVNMRGLESAFAKAGAALQRPILRIADIDRDGDGKPTLKHGFIVSRAPDTGKNAGALYVREGETYLGKVVAGKFLATRQCAPDVEQSFICAAADPNKSTRDYGVITGNCGCCGARLTNSESLARGIGPICAENWGL